MLEQILDFCVDFSFYGVMLLFVSVYLVSFYRRNIMINRNADGDQLMAAYLKLRTFREHPSSSQFKSFMPPDERKRLAQNLLNLEESRNENNMH